MEIHYLSSGQLWYDLVATWSLLLPLLALLATGGWKKSYAGSLAISALSLFFIGLSDNEYLGSILKGFDITADNLLLILHSMAATFLLVHFTPAEKQKDQRLILYILTVAIVLLLIVMGLQTVIFIIILMTQSLIYLMYGMSATLNLLEEIRDGNHAVRGRLVMTMSLLTARIGLLSLFGADFLMVPKFQSFSLFYEILTTLWAIGMAIGLAMDKGYDPENAEADDGPYQALPMDAIPPFSNPPDPPPEHRENTRKWF